METVFPRCWIAGGVDGGWGQRQRYSRGHARNVQGTCRPCISLNHIGPRVQTASPHPSHSLVEDEGQGVLSLSEAAFRKRERFLCSFGCLQLCKELQLHYFMQSCVRSFSGPTAPRIVATSGMRRDGTYLACLASPKVIVCPFALTLTLKRSLGPIPMTKKNEAPVNGCRPKPTQSACTHPCSALMCTDREGCTTQAREMSRDALGMLRALWPNTRFCLHTSIPISSACAKHVNCSSAA